MADIQLRFNRDMLVLSTPIDAVMSRVGMDFDRDNELALLIEPEILHEAYSLEVAVGAQCIVADTANITPARLAHSRCKTSAKEIAEAALSVLSDLSPQHILVEIAPCGLPLDASSADSLNENRDQYMRAARTFDHLESQFDAYFLNGFESTTDLKCALMGLRKVTDKPIFASVNLALGKDDESDNSTLDSSAWSLGGKGSETIKDAAQVMAEYGAQVAGFSISGTPEAAQAIVDVMESISILPVLVQLNIAMVDPEQKKPTEANPYFEADTMVDAAERLQAAGVQFLRAVGNATPSYTGALVAATIGEDVARTFEVQPSSIKEDQDLDELAATLKARLDAALNK